MAPLYPALTRQRGMALLAPALARQRGMALLAMLGLLLLIFTSALIARLSLNDQASLRIEVTAVSLAAVRDALVGYSQLAKTTPQPPGSLPCPAQDRDGQSAPVNPATGRCIRVGLVPYRTLGIVEPLDGTGAPLWYAPAAELTGDSNPSLGLLRNSSTTTNLTLKITTTNKLEAVAFVLLAPNRPLGAQRPNTSPLAAAREFLEGTNAAANTTQYDDLNDAQHNDQVLGMPLGQFWSHIERRVLLEVQQALLSYRSQCGAYPFAAVWGAPGNNSKPDQYEGAVPLGTAYPFDWGATCGLKTAPLAPADWLRKHWGRLYYAQCDPAASPPSTRCLQVSTPANTAAKVIVMAPGIKLGAVLPAQNRSQLGLGNYFEALGTTPRSFTQKPVNQHTQMFNDVLFIIE